MICIISPHIDDAVLSLGGSMLSWCSKGEKVHVIYLFTRSSWTNPNAISNHNYNNRPGDITEIRKQEEEEASRIIGHSYQMLEFSDFPLRSINAKKDIGDEVLKEIGPFIDKNKICFFPLGIEHPDHMIGREVGTKLKAEGYKILFYEDLPYAAFGSYNYRKFCLDNIDKGLKPVVMNIDIEQKLQASKQYKSQVSGHWLTNIRNYSYNLETNSHMERFWAPEDLDLDLELCLYV